MNAESERDVWHRQLAKVGIPEQYWGKIIEAAHDMETLAEDGMRWEPDANYHDGDCPACGKELGSNAAVCDTCAAHEET